MTVHCDTPELAVTQERERERERERTHTHIHTHPANDLAERNLLVCLSIYFFLPSLSHFLPPLPLSLPPPPHFLFPPPPTSHSRSSPPAPPQMLSILRNFLLLSLHNVPRLSFTPLLAFPLFHLTGFLCLCLFFIFIFFHSYCKCRMFIISIFLSFIAFLSTISSLSNFFSFCFFFTRHFLKVRF